MASVRTALASLVLVALAVVACAAWALARRLNPEAALPDTGARIVVPKPTAWPPAWQVHDVRVMDMRQ